MKINTTFNTDNYTPLEIIAMLYTLNKSHTFNQFVRLYRYACKAYTQTWVDARINELEKFYSQY